MQFIKRSLEKGIMQQILDCFVELTGIRAAYFENHVELVNGKNKDMCSFCRLIRQIPQLHEGCLESDRSAVKIAEETKNPYLYTCHMGLWETVIPVFVRNIPTGYLMLGQVKNTEENDKQWPEISERLCGLKTSASINEDIKFAYYDIQGMNIEKIQAAVKMLAIIAGYIIDTDVIRVYDLEAVEKAKEYIAEHFSEHISTKTIAGIAGLSPSYLGFLFKRETGNTITSHIEDRRNKFAKELLETTALPVREIACASGYEDQNYFSRIFKKLEGVSPLAYRHNSRNNFGFK